MKMSFNFYTLYMNGKLRMSIFQQVLIHPQISSIEKVMG